MNRTIKKVFPILLILAAFSAPARAWDDVGHKITGYIAWQQMRPDVRETVIKILLSAPEDSQLGTFYQSYGSRTEETRKREYFMLATTWADIVRDRKFETRYKKYHHSNWHYSDTFWRSVNGAIQVLPAPEEGGRGMERLIEYSKLIRGNESNAEKAIALAWIQHLIGDLHQPLHTSARVTDTEPKGDQGGNLFLLTPRGTPRADQENLHWFWDSIVIRNIPNSSDACEAEYIDPVARSIMKKYPAARMQIHPGDFGEWTKESLAAAQRDVFSADLKRFETPTTAYKRKALKIAEQRLALAGYRMGELFNSAFPAAAAPAVSQ